MAHVILPAVETFMLGTTEREQAMKVLEEAAEVMAAQRLEDRERVIEECADVIQATCNLLRMLGVSNMTSPMAACNRRNRERGRL